MRSIQKSLPVGLLAAAAAVAGCGSSTSNSSSVSLPVSSSTSASGSSAGSTTAGPAALAADTHSAATGDIPDNQVFLVYANRAAGFSMKYPEGWTQSGPGRDVIFRDKNNLVHVAISPGAAPTVSSVAAQLNGLAHTNPTLTFSAPVLVQLPSGPAVKAVYTTRSAPNPVTGKRVKLIVDRYALGGSGRRTAVVDLGTPKGVDNVDAYRMMIESFRWK
ncbi:MAG TPA: PsbP-related protein [Solirubrobacteraceae bacterium]|nr:PsbP-related protein [Solirubrobacteraceae bacterium]